MDIQIVKPNLILYDKWGLLYKNKSRLTAYHDQLPVGGKCENVEFAIGSEIDNDDFERHNWR